VLAPNDVNHVVAFPVLLSVKLKDICVVAAKVAPLKYIPPVGGSVGDVLKAVKTHCKLSPP